MSETWNGFKCFIAGVNPVRLVAFGYLSYAVVGWVLLSLPWVQSSDAVSGLDALFTSTSALSTTGLGTVSTGNDFNLAGQILILILIELGGIGYMTFGSFVVLSTSGTLSERRRQIGTTVFSLPEGFRIDKFIRSVIVFTAATEAIGAVALFVALSRLGVPDALWSSIFHSVSAFCTAGFSLYDRSFEQMRGDFAVNTILGVLSYLGGMGFIVFVDVWRRLIGKTAGLTLTTKVIVVTTAWVSIVAVGLFFVGEPTIRQLPPQERLTAAAFQVMAAITTVGFNTIPIGTLSQASLFLLTMLMIIGASPSGTGGGLKTTTFSAVFGVMRSALAGRKEVRFLGRAVPEQRIWVAMASLGFYAVSLIVGCYLLALTESFPFEGLLFEAASALGTVGLSTGITPDLTPLGKLIITALMFIGRVGPLAFGVAVFLPTKEVAETGKEDLAV